MIQLSDIFTAQARYGVGSEILSSESIPYKSYLIGCRNNISDKTPAEYYSWDKTRQSRFTDSAIVKYVMDNRKAVTEFIDELTGDLEIDRLIDRLKTDIVDFGILRDALNDDEVQEIQINDFKTIYVIKGGKSELYVDEKGKPCQFVSDEELKATIDRMIYTPQGTVARMTQTDPLLNARTANKGYRLSAVDGSAVTRDMTLGFDFPTTSITIRKYSASRLTFEDFEKFGSIDPLMSKFLRLCGRADTRLVCVGATSSGKTTLLQAVVWEIPDDLRIIFIQNPTELMLYDRDPLTGVNRRNALHWEAREVSDAQKNSSTSPTMANFIAHTLRNTPEVAIPGEIRTPEEFYQANRVVKTGHRVMTTFHAEDAQDGAMRWATELATVGGSVAEHLQGAINSLDVVVAQRKLADGRRKIMEIAEYTGKIDKETGKPEVNVIFQYTLTGNADYDPDNPDKVKKIYGYFEQVNPISARLVKKFYLAGITKELVDEFLHPPKQIEGMSNIVHKEAI